MSAKKSDCVMSTDEEHAARVKCSLYMLVGGFLPCAIIGIVLATAFTWSVPRAELNANPGLRQIPPAIAGTMLVVGSLFPLLGWLKGPAFVAGTRRAQDKKALSARFGLCGKCGTTLAVRVNADSITSTGDAGIGWKWQWQFSRTCPKCTNAPCCFDKCTAKAEVSLPCSIGVGGGKARVLIQDDALLCPIHLALLKRWYSIVGWQRALSAGIGFISLWTALIGFAAGFSGELRGGIAIGVGAVAVAALTFAIVAINERRVSRSLFGAIPKRKAESTIRIRGETGSQWDNEFF